MTIISQPVFIMSQIAFRWLCCSTALLLMLPLTAKASEYDLKYQKWRNAHQQNFTTPSNRSTPHGQLGQANTHDLAQPTRVAAQAKISLNHATLEQLQQLSGIGEQKAKTIIEFRQKNGPFKRIEELQNVKGIGPKLFEKNRDRLSL